MKRKGFKTGIWKIVILGTTFNGFWLQIAAPEFLKFELSPRHRAHFEVLVFCCLDSSWHLPGQRKETQNEAKIVQILPQSALGLPLEGSWALFMAVDL